VDFVMLDELVIPGMSPHDARFVLFKRIFIEFKDAVVDALVLSLVKLFGWTVLWVFTRGDSDEDVPVIEIFSVEYP
jgi:hypothetical protein